MERPPYDVDISPAPSRTYYLSIHLREVPRAGAMAAWSPTWISFRLASPFSCCGADSMVGFRPLRSIVHMPTVGEWLVMLQTVATRVHDSRHLVGIAPIEYLVGPGAQWMEIAMGLEKHGNPLWNLVHESDSQPRLQLVSWNPRNVLQEFQAENSHRRQEYLDFYNLHVK